MVYHHWQIKVLTKLNDGQYMLTYGERYPLHFLLSYIIVLVAVYYKGKRRE